MGTRSTLSGASAHPRARVQDRTRRSRSGCRPTRSSFATIDSVLGCCGQPILGCAENVGRSFGFSDAYAKRDRALNARTKSEKVWYADGSDGDPRAGTAHDPWVVNEDAARKQAIADAPDLEKLAERADVRRFVDARGRKIEMKQDISPGWHGQDGTIYGARATFES